VDHLLKDDHAPSSHYRLVRDRFCPHDDGNATRRTVDWFFKGCISPAYVRSANSSSSSLFWGGRLDSTLKSIEFISRVAEAADDPDRHPVLFVSHSVKTNDKLMDAIAALGSGVTVIARNDHEMTMTGEESIARSIRRGSNPTDFSSAMTAQEVDRLLDQMYE